MILIILLLIIIYFIIKYLNNIDEFNTFYSNTWYKNDYLDNNKKIKNLYSNNPELELNNYKEDDYLPINISNNQNQKISDVYNNSIKSYKNYKKKELIECPVIDGATNLQFINPNIWNYKDENIINGGTMEDNIYAYDELTNQPNSIF